MRTQLTRLGYTLVEVMMAITMLTIGAAGVMAMQKASVEGNQDARDVDQATAIARQWMDRIKRDATLWTPSDNGPTANRAQATLLDEGIANGFVWYAPTVRATVNNLQNDYETAGFDMLGRDVPAANWALSQGALSSNDNSYAATPGLRYCTNVRVQSLGDGSMVRVEVRVFWPQMLLSATAVNNFCGTLPNDTDVTTYHFVHLVSALRMNVAP